MPHQWLACGLGFQGELGRPVKEKEENIVQALQDVTLPEGVTSVRCAQFHNLCIDGNGNAFTWGSNLHGQLALSGDHDQFAFCSEPRKVMIDDRRVNDENDGREERIRVLEAAGGRSFSLFRTADKIFISGRIPHRQYSHQDNSIEALRELELDGQAGQVERMVCGSGHALFLLEGGRCYLLHHAKMHLPKVASDRKDLVGFDPPIGFPIEEEVEVPPAGAEQMAKEEIHIDEDHFADKQASGKEGSSQPPSPEETLGLIQSSNRYAESPPKSRRKQSADGEPIPKRSSVLTTTSAVDSNPTPRFAKVPSPKRSRTPSPKQSKTESPDSPPVVGSRLEDEEEEEGVVKDDREEDHFE